MLKVGIIIGSTRPGRKAATVAKWAHDTLKSRKDETDRSQVAFEMRPREELPISKRPARASATLSVVYDDH